MVLLACATAPTIAAAAPGDLDRMFSGDGTVFTDFSPGAPSSTRSSEFAYAIALAPGAKTVAVGCTGSAGDLDNCRLFVVRYNADGSLDRTFSGDGWLVNSSLGPAVDVVVQRDGRILVAVGAPSGGDIVLLRYTESGRTDRSFSSDGVAVAAFPGFRTSRDSGVKALALQSDGKIVVAGTVGPRLDPEEPSDFGLARFTSEGELDTTFSEDGRTTTDFAYSRVQGRGNDYDKAADVAIDREGRIVVAGSTNSSVAVARYRADGSLDASFSGDGRQTALLCCNGESPAPAFAAGLAFGPNGSILVVGNIDPGGENFVRLIRINRRGGVDASFDAACCVLSGDRAGGVAVAADGKVIVAGRSAFVPVRFSADGSRDPSFTPPPTRKLRTASADDLALQPDGRIVVAGSSFRRGQNDIALARYLGGGAADLSLSSARRPRSVRRGTELTYRLKLRNRGSGPAEQVELEQLLPKGVELLSARSPEARCRQPRPRRVRCGLGTVAAGTAVRATVRVRVERGGTLVSRASAKSPTYDPTRGNNFVVVRTATRAADSRRP